MTAVILQARINSTRLPGKALMDIAGKPLIVRVMERLSLIDAHSYILACDPSSVPEFTPLAQECGFTLMSGDPDDVLDRYCSVIRSQNVDTVIRATGDNPFVFADAADAALERFTALQKDGVSYFGFDGLPYGAGVEIINAADLLEAEKNTSDPFDREHVAPALYRHAARYRCVREPAPAPWNRPEVRITVDTREDYDRICRMADYFAIHSIPFPSSTGEILESWTYSERSIVFVPAYADGRGSGHFRRLCSIARALRLNHPVSILDPEGTMPVTADIPVVKKLPDTASLVVSDLFRSSGAEIAALQKAGPVLTLDDGGPGRDLADYVLDTIPSLPAKTPANLDDPSFLTLPVRRKMSGTDEIHTVLVAAGGLDEEGLARPAAIAAAGLFSHVTLIDPLAPDAAGETTAAGEKAFGERAQDSVTPLPGNVRVTGCIPDLREKLADYDLVITHYGLTAFEALAAGCSVILFSPTRYHWRLARYAGFSVIPPGSVSVRAFRQILNKGIARPECITPETEHHDLAGFISELTAGRKQYCPLCGSKKQSILHRRPAGTIVRCGACGMLYTSFRAGKIGAYEKSYFFEEYRAQYGKTYIDDFESIKNQGRERISEINRIKGTFLSRLDDEDKRILDIGCAYGPFLDAAYEAGWDPAGTDICEEAVEWVRTRLGIPAVTAAFPAFNPGLLKEMRPFAAVTLWYVIEHFEDLEPVFQQIRQLLIPGGILAFSTPSAEGVSARMRRRLFFDQSPEDHYTLWKPSLVRRQLERYGFRVVRVRSTGHHPERFPGCRQLSPESFHWKVLTIVSRLFRLGDTFEVYAIKRGTVEDAE